MGARAWATPCGAVVSILAIGCSAGEELALVSGPGMEIQVNGSRLVYRDDGRIDLLRDDGSAVLIGAVGAVLLDATDTTGRRISIDSAKDRSARTFADHDDLGDAQRIVVTARGQAGDPDLRWVISGYPSGGFYTFRIEVDNHTGSAVTPGPR